MSNDRAIIWGKSSSWDRRAITRLRGVAEWRLELWGNQIPSRVFLAGAILAHVVHGMSWALNGSEKISSH